MEFSRLIFSRRLSLTGLHRKLEFHESGIGFFKKNKNKNLEIVLHKIFILSNCFFKKRGKELYLLATFAFFLKKVLFIRYFFA